MTDEEFLNQYGQGLNEAQREAVQAAEGAVLLLAVPGSGKTTVLVTRLGYLVRVRGISPASILTMTYTVAATREMTARYIRTFGEEYSRGMEFRTINGLSQKIIDYCGQITNKEAFQLQDNEGELARLVREIYRSVNDDFPTDSTIRDIRTTITYIKNMMLSPEEIQKLDIGVNHLPEIFQLYCKTLRDARQMDYDDQMQYALTILKTRPAVLEHFQERFRYICVDEAQDTSKIQHEMIRILASKYGNLFMVGDEDQSIYSFRAAYPDALVQFESIYPNARVLVMEHNYRSTDQIVEAANHFVEKNRFRHPKQIQGTCGSGTPIQIIDIASRGAQYAYLHQLARDCTQETAVLFRNNESAVPLIDLLEREGIPYNCRRFDEVFFSHRIITDITDIILFAHNPTDQERFLRIYYKFNCGISKKAALFACHQSGKTGKSIVRELLNFPELKPFTRNNVEDLITSLEALPSDSAAAALRQISNDMGYLSYLDQNNLDPGKIDILTFIGRGLPSPLALLERLEQLRSLITSHENRLENKFLLSTIHSSKGLEYERVYLLDVFDGILPVLTDEEATDEDKIRSYEEERRLFYVAMTRAKLELNLFHCQMEPSEFVQEIRKTIPRETFQDTELLSFLKRRLIGKTHRHREYGTGIVRAQKGESLLVEYPGPIVRLYTMDELIRFREQSFTPPDPPKPVKKPRNRAGKPITPMKFGDLVEHIKFGSGVVRDVDVEKITVYFERDQKERTFLKSSVIPTGKLKLKDMLF